MHKLHTNIIKIRSSLAYFVTASFALLKALPASAIETGLETTAGTAGLNTGGGDLTTIVANLVQQLLGFVGVIFVIIVIAAGFLWMTAGGSEEKVTKAKKMLTGATIGLIIVLGAYSITSFIVSSIESSVG